MSFAQVHFRSAVYALATGEGPIMDRLRDVEDYLKKVADFNRSEIPPQLMEKFLKLREDLDEALKARNYPAEEASGLASRIVRFYENIHDPATH